MKSAKKIAKLVVILFIAVRIIAVFGPNMVYADDLQLQTSTNLGDTASSGTVDPSSATQDTLRLNAAPGVAQEVPSDAATADLTPPGELTPPQAPRRGLVDPLTPPSRENSVPATSIDPVFHVDTYLKLDSQNSRVPNANTPTGGDAPAYGIVAFVVDVIDLLIKFIGGVALIIFIIGALMTIIAQGKEDLLEKGKKTMLYAIYGLIIAFTSYIIVTAVQSVLF